MRLRFPFSNDYLFFSVFIKYRAQELEREWWMNQERVEPSVPQANILIVEALALYMRMPILSPLWINNPQRTFFAQRPCADLSTRACGGQPTSRGVARRRLEKCAAWKRVAQTPAHKAGRTKRGSAHEKRLIIHNTYTGRSRGWDRLT